MKKSTIKVSWDNLQAINQIAWKLSQEKREKITQDQAIRYLLEVNKGGTIERK